MPFAVSKWPYTPDPRTAIFGGYGWDYGEVPPWSWIVRTSGANGPWSYLNDGVILKSSFDSLDATVWTSVDAQPGDEVRVTKFGPAVSPWPGLTLNLTVQFRTGDPIRLSEAVKFYLYPNGIQVFGGFVIRLVETGEVDPWIPNPVAIEPAIWNIESP